MNNKRLIVVLGMHRSGTSAITRSLQVLGVELGDKLSPGTVGENDKGFWEDADVKQLNENMLDQISSSWHHFLPISEPDLEKILQKGYLSVAKDLILKKTEHHPIFGMKDPRLVRLLPFWKKVFSSLGISTSYIITLRNPLSVSQSLYSRNRFPIEQGCLMWVDHMVASLAGTIGEDRIIVDYDKLMDNPERVIKTVSEKMGLAIDKTKLKKYLNDFLDPQLRHSTFSLRELQENDSVPELAYDIYTTLSALDQEKRQLLKPMITRKIIKWNESIFHQRQALRLCNYYVDKFHQSESLLGERTRQLAERDTQLAKIYSSKIWKLGVWLRRVFLWITPVKMRESFSRLRGKW